jgi:hypothetical protein
MWSNVHAITKKVCLSPLLNFLYIYAYFHSNSWNGFTARVLVPSVSCLAFDIWQNAASCALLQFRWSQFRSWPLGLAIRRALSNKQGRTVHLRCQIAPPFESIHMATINADMDSRHTCCSLVGDVLHCIVLLLKWFGTKSVRIPLASLR